LRDDLKYGNGGDEATGRWCRSEDRSTYVNSFATRSRTSESDRKVLIALIEMAVHATGIAQHVLRCGMLI